MTNYYSLLGLPESLSLDPAFIDDAWRALNRSFSTADPSGDDGEEANRAINQARATLSDPVARLAHWLALKAPSAIADRSIDPELMDLFAQISPVLGATDALLARHHKATTALTRAILTREAVASQLKIQALLQRLQSLKSAIIGQFDTFEKNILTGDSDAAFKGLGQLKFLKRWEEQCQERLLALIAI